MSQTMCDLKRQALIEHLGRDEGTIHCICKGGITFGNNGKEYLVLTDEEADERAAAYIKESLWAFNASFLVNYIPCFNGASDSALEGFTAIIKSFQQNLAEESNDVLLRLVGEDLDCLTEAAFQEDGRAHFLNTYDDQEHEHAKDGVVEFYIYRVN